MSPLTKAFVVLVTLLAVVLVALVVPFAARVDDYAQQYREKDQQLQAQLEKGAAALADERAKFAEAGAAIAELERQLAAEKQTSGNLTANITELEAQVADAVASSNRTAAALDVLTRNVETKDQRLADSAKLVNEQIATLGQQQSQIADLTQALIAARADVSRLTSAYQRVQEENKALETKLGEAVARVEVLAERLASAGIDAEQVATSTAGPVPNIRGAVVKVDEVANDLTFVQVNVGTRDQVREGMEFTVFRGDEFVGKIRISTVDTAEAVGRLTLGGGIQEGDQIKTGGR